MADQTPGLYTSFDRSGDYSGTAPNNRLLAWGLVPPGAPCTPGVPFLASSLTQVQQQCGATWAQLARNYQAAKAEPASVGAEIWCCGVADPAGTAATRLLKFAAQPTYDASNGWQLGSATAAALGTDCYIDFGGQVVVFGIAAGDTWAQCAAKALTALQTLGADLIYTPSVNSETITLTDKHASALTDDVPVRVWFSNPSAGVGIILGTLTLAMDASGAGTVSLTDGVNTASDTLANADTPVTTAQNLRDSINRATGYRAALANPATGVITLFARDDSYARRLSVSITAGIGTTAVLAAGTAGSGTPSLSALLALLAAEATAYRAWALAQADATALGAVAAHLISQDATPIEKGQIAFAAISTALPGTSLIGATTPALSTTELTIVLHGQGFTVPAAQMAARVAVQVAAETDQARNYNLLRLNASDAMPLAAAHKRDRSGRDVWNAGISAGYAPVSVDDSGKWYVVMARTTWGSASPQTQKLKKWSGALLPIYFRADLRQTLTSVFFKPGEGRSLKARGAVHTERAISEKGVKSETLVLVTKWDRLDYFDGVKGVAQAMRVTIVGGVVKVVVPFRSVTDLDRVEFSGYPD